MPLSDNSRGKLSLGDLTILFQFVTEPPRQPKPMLPASVRGTFADRFDPRLSRDPRRVDHRALRDRDHRAHDDVETEHGIADRAYNLTFKQDSTRSTSSSRRPDAGSAAGSAARQRGAEKKPEKKPSRRQEAAEERRRRSRQERADVQLQQEENARAMADLLTGEGTNGTSEGDMSKRRPGADLGTQIADVREGGKTVASVVAPVAARAATAIRASAPARARRSTAPAAPRPRAAARKRRRRPVASQVAEQADVRRLER